MQTEVIQAARMIGHAINAGINADDEPGRRLKSLSLDLQNCHDDGKRVIGTIGEWACRLGVQLPPQADTFIAAILCGDVSGREAADVLRTWACVTESAD